MGYARPSFRIFFYENAIVGQFMFGDGTLRPLRNILLEESSKRAWAIQVSGSWTQTI
jgi:hypothetical protein